MLVSNSPNVLTVLSRSAHPGASAAMKEICITEDIDMTQAASKAFELDYGAKYPKTVTKIVDDRMCCSSLRVSGGALGASAHHEPDRIDIRHGSTPDEDRLPRGKVPVRPDLPWPTS